MANDEQVERLLAGVKGWNQWRRKNPRVTPDLRAADFREANLEGADFERADFFGATLTRANLTGTNLTGANLSASNLTGADLSAANLNDARLTRANLNDASLKGANLNDASLKGANLIGTNLTRANLIGTNLTGTNLTGADFTQTRIGLTMFGAVDLRGVLGLATVIFAGPSTLGLDTIELSQNLIPESFLRGCGVSDQLINYIPSLTTQPIQYYSLFISYSSHDQALAERLHADLQVKGVRCWYAPHDLEIGEPILSGIDRGIRLHDKLLLILSAASVKSAWIEQEVHMALARERNERRYVLFPIRIDDSVSEQTAGWPALVWNQRHVGDFCQWTDYAAYQAAFTRLLRDLKATPDR